MPDILLTTITIFYFFMKDNAEAVAALFPGSTVKEIKWKDGIGNTSEWIVVRRSGNPVTTYDAGWDFSKNCFVRIDNDQPVDDEGINLNINSCMDCSDFGTEVCDPCKRGY